MASKNDKKDSSAARIGKNTLELLLMDFPLIGWIFVAFFTWQEVRRQKRAKSGTQTTSGAGGD